MPFEQYDVQNIQSVVTASLTPSGSVGRTTTTNRFNPFVVVPSAVQSIVRPYNLSISANRQSVVSAVLNPIIDDPSVYAAYANFLNYGHGIRPSSTPNIRFFGENVLTVRRAPTPPADGYIKKTIMGWDGNYYWIPLRYEEQFAELWMAMVARNPSGTPANVANKTLKALNQGNATGTVRTFTSPLAPQGQ